MSNRIHKALGYGLKLGSRIIDDNIINLNSILDEEGPWDRNSYLKWLNFEREIAKEDEKDSFIEEIQCVNSLSNWEPRDFVIYTENLLLLQTAGEHKDWYRSNDLIDTIEWHLYLKDSYLDLNQGIGTYADMWMDTRTGNILKKGAIFLQFLALLNVPNRYDEINIILNKLAKEMDFIDRIEVVKYIKPYISLSIRYICRFGNLFRNNNYMQLRPMICTFWG